jgi:hypothetical protein
VDAERTEPRSATPLGNSRVEQVDGKWWFVDPDGHLFFSVSSNRRKYQLHQDIERELQWMGPMLELPTKMG